MRETATGKTLADVGEFALITAITADLPGNAAVQLGPGDDGAVLRVDGPLISSVDALVEGVHFRRDWSEAQDVGRKAVAVNVADIEAMGGRAVGILVAFSAPGETPASWALEFAAGLRAECANAGVALLGGDVTRARDITISVTVLGVTDGLPLVRRDGARAGDVLAIVGRIGWAAAGMVVLGRGFRSPRVVVEAQRAPQVPYGQGAIAAAAGATSMIDISDGLLGDLSHVAQASGVTIDVHTAAFEVPEPLQAVAAATGSDPYTLILTGGEDHALAATFGSIDQVPAGWRVIGTVTEPAEDGPVLVDGSAWQGTPGFDHFRGGRR
ncbi:MAG TPA: thiamine-phosphate kinase [Propionibacteriaceae bacterium]|nr:thiamine-phosphate kinase [Propionibacteriaceae bacterium]